MQRAGETLEARAANAVEPGESLRPMSKRSQVARGVANAPWSTQQSFAAEGMLPQYAEFCPQSIDAGTKSDQRWRDIFPIPQIPESRALRRPAHGSSSTTPSTGAVRHAGRRLYNLGVANSVIEASNAMYAHGCSASNERSPTHAQTEAQNSILAAVVKNQHSKTCMSQQEAVHELLQDGHAYTGHEVAPSTVRSYDRARVSINPVGACIPQVLDIIDPIGRETLMDMERIMLSDSEVNGERLDQPRIQSYMDENLRKKQISIFSLLLTFFSEV